MMDRILMGMGEKHVFFSKRVKQYECRGGKILFSFMFLGSPAGVL